MIKPRNIFVKQMRLHTKPGAMRDRKKELNKKLCRQEVEMDVVKRIEGREVTFKLGAIARDPRDLELVVESWLEAVDPEGFKELLNMVEAEGGRQGDDLWLDSLLDTVEFYAPEGYYSGWSKETNEYGFWKLEEA
jgi:hypothetical protein